MKLRTNERTTIHIKNMPEMWPGVMTVYQISADKMYRLRVKLKARLKKTPEDDIERRQMLTRKIEMLNIIIPEMRILINQLKS